MLEPWRTVIGEYYWPDATRQNVGLASAILARAARADAPGQGPTYPRLTHLYEQGRFDAIDIRPDLPQEFWQFLCRGIEDTLAEIRPGSYRARREHITSIWPNVSASGDYHRPHRHSALEHILAGTYYVQVPPGSTEEEGALTLVDPRNTIGGGNAYRRFYDEGEIRLNVRPGYLVLFPPHVLHYVTPHRSPTARVSISFNVDIKIIQEES